MEKKELSLQLNNINIGDFKMKKTNFAVAGLSLCLLFQVVEPIRRQVQL